MSATGTSSWPTAPSSKKGIPSRCSPPQAINARDSSFRRSSIATAKWRGRRNSATPEKRAATPHRGGKDMTSERNNPSKIAEEDSKKLTRRRLLTASGAAGVAVVAAGTLPRMASAAEVPAVDTSYKDFVISKLPCDDSLV